MDQIHKSLRGTGRCVNDLQMEMIELLILHGAPIDALDGEGDSPL